MVTTHYNNLSPAEAERLALLLEELGEAQQAIGKILRHGYESYHPLAPSPTNREMLEREIGDIIFALGFMEDAGDLNRQSICDHKNNKAVNVRKYLHHQGA
ncbi:MAG: hypothetical protein EPN22_16915 [Nitrospirae bacterium]|nr:MAG: hypothetical protein EPN22_16915 [Nitrospirota bacterium]